MKRGQTKKKPTKSRMIATHLVLKDIEWPDQLFLAQSLPLKKGPHICTKHSEKYKSLQKKEMEVN